MSSVIIGRPPNRQMDEIRGGCKLFLPAGRQALNGLLEKSFFFLSISNVNGRSHYKTCTAKEYQGLHEVEFVPPEALGRVTKKTPMFEERYQNQ